MGKSNNPISHLFISILFIKNLNFWKPKFKGDLDPDTALYNKLEICLNLLTWGQRKKAFENWDDVLENIAKAEAWQKKNKDKRIDGIRAPTYSICEPVLLFSTFAGSNSATGRESMTQRLPSGNWHIVEGERKEKHAKKKKHMFVGGRRGKRVRLQRR